MIHWPELLPEEMLAGYVGRVGRTNGGTRGCDGFGLDCSRWRIWYHAPWFYVHSIVRGGIDKVHVGLEIAPAA